jgi:hypothetical protein
MAARTVPVIFQPLPTFSGRKKEDVVEFIEAVDCFFQLEKGLYDEESVPGARRSLLAVCCRGKATLFIKHLHPARKDTWEHLTAELIEKYASSSAENRARAIHKAMKLKQKSDEELRAYAKRAKKLAKRVDPTLEKVVAAHFVQGIRNRNIRMMVAVNSLNKSDYTFSDVYQAVQAVYRAMEEDSESESDSDLSSSSTDSSVGGSRRHHDAKKAEEHKATEVEVKRSNPAPTQFNMDDIAKFIKENVQASTRKLAGQQQRYQPPYRRSTDNGRPAVMEPYSAQDARSIASSDYDHVSEPQSPGGQSRQRNDLFISTGWSHRGQCGVIPGGFDDRGDLCSRKEEGGFVGPRLRRF